MNNDGGGGCGGDTRDTRQSSLTRCHGSSIPPHFSPHFSLKTASNDNGDSKINHKTINRILVKWKEVGIINMNDK